MFGKVLGSVRSRGVLLLAFLPVVGMVAGCGFQLRGNVSISPALQPLFIESVSPNGEGTKQLKRVLHSSGATVAATAAEAKTVIRVRRDEMSERIAAVSGATGLADQYFFTYTLDFSVADRDRELIAPTPITQTRTLQYDPSNVAGKRRESEQMRVEMARDAVLQLLRRLEALR